MERETFICPCNSTGRFRVTPTEIAENSFSRLFDAGLCLIGCASVYLCGGLLCFAYIKRGLFPRLCMDRLILGHCIQRGCRGWQKWDNCSPRSTLWRKKKKRFAARCPDMPPSEPHPLVNPHAVLCFHSCTSHFNKNIYRMVEIHVSCAQRDISI